MAAVTLRPPWAGEEPELSRSDAAALPGEVDVLVVGASLAGLAAAAYLAEGGARVALCAEEALLGGFSLRAPGLVLQSMGEHPRRLLDSVGPAEARAMMGFLEENRALLDEMGLLRTTGSLAAAAMDGEEAEILEGMDAALAIGQQAEAWTLDQVDARLGPCTLGAGRHQARDGRVDPPAPARRLVARARAAGARLCPGLPVTALEEDGGPVAITAAGPLRAEALVLAAGWRLPPLEGWFAPVVYPVRHQWIATAPVAPGRLPLAVSGQHGMSQWLQLADGRVLAGGARFGTAHMEAGETDDGVIQARIDHILRSNLARFFPDLAETPVTHAWTAIASHGCDGLPLIGPLPGRVERVACTGFHGLDHALAVRAGQVVAEGLLGRPRVAIPRLFQPTRLV